ncbi:DUF4434_domain-containing protein [Hexamita inflata]|uniref:DUF4434 domain-containing protein n=1 Tax=Hexamita inflata TaxID=28002 RepID=A0AA86R3T0_9EUKA|nr:DUF4434 domain-containing protein [Hexamita inflata]
MILQISFLATMPISGIFDAGWNSFFRNQSQIDLQVSNMKKLNLDTLILQYSIDKTQRFYDSKLPFAAGTANNSYFERIIPSAAKQNMSIYLGVYAENDGWWTTPDDAYLFRQRDNSIKVIDELLAKFPQAAIKGFYIPHEIARYYWQVPADMQRLVNNFVKPVSDYAHSKNKTMMISPFFNQDLETSAQDYSFFRDMLVNSSVDIVAVQDGVGSNAARRNFSVEYMTAIAKAAMETKKQFWTNVELFEASAPANITRIAQQCVNGTTVKASKLISYDYSSVTLDHYAQTMQPMFTDLVNWNAKTKCQFQNKFFYNNTCYAICPGTMLSFNGTCVTTCPTSTPLTFNKSCVIKCPMGYTAGTNKVCVQNKSGQTIGITVGVVVGVVVIIAIAIGVFAFVKNNKPKIGGKPMKIHVKLTNKSMNYV